MSTRSRTTFWVTLALATLGALWVTQLASATHPRPKGASPLRVPLVPAYKQCTSPNSTHGAPLQLPSCVPPIQESSYLTVGTPDANGAAANSTGYILLKGKQTAYDYVDMTAEVTDVRCKPGTSAGACSSANSADGPDYSGDLLAMATVRVTDHMNGPNENEAGTVQDIPFPISMPCVNTADTSIGGFCSSTFAPRPLIPIRDISGFRTVIEITDFDVSDGGADGDPNSPGNTPFLHQGIFIP